MPIDIRRVLPGDEALLDRIAPDVFDGPMHPEHLAACLAAPGHLMVLAISDDEVIGQARGMIHRNPDEPALLYIDNLGVTPARQREGVATRLLDELVAWARSLGCAGGWVATETENDPAIALYESRGAKGQRMVFFEYRF